MNFKKITLSLLCGGAAVASMGQALTQRIFTYDGYTSTNGLATYILNGDGAGATIFAGSVNGSVPNQNGVSGASITNAAFLVSTVVNVSSYVYISGNFGGVYTVQGVGAAYDNAVNVNQVEILTNRSLTFTASGFYGLGPNVGAIAYTMSLYQDFPSNGVVLAGTGAALYDNFFNGATVELNATTELPLDGRATLQITRQLQLTQAAQGGHTYTAAGTIQVGVN
jgi:hypothetical protein